MAWKTNREAIQRGMECVIRACLGDCRETSEGYCGDRLKRNEGWNDRFGPEFSGVS